MLKLQFVACNVLVVHKAYLYTHRVTESPSRDEIIDIKYCSCIMFWL